MDVMFYQSVLSTETCESITQEETIMNVRTREKLY